MTSINIADWLRKLALEQYEPALRENNVDAQVLPRLTAENLKDHVSEWRRARLMLCITEKEIGITEQRLMTKVTSKGQVTIPKPLRDHLGLEAGSSVEFELAGDGRVFLVARRPPPKSKFARLRGSARSRMTTDEIMALTRGEDGG